MTRRISISVLLVHGTLLALLATGAIGRASTSDETMLYPVLSPDGNSLAYASWTSIPDGQPGSPPPAPPFRLRVTDLRTGDTRTVLENEEYPYGPLVWSPEGKRLLVALPDAREDFGSLLGVDIGTGETWAADGWVPGPNGPLTPQLWLPGERVVLTKDDRSIHLLDLDNEFWKKIDEAPGVEVMGYLLPGVAADAPYGRLLKESSFVSESPSPDGEWTARLFVSDPLHRGDWHRSQLRLERTDGSQTWTAIDEYIAHAICGDDMVTIGWTAGGDYLFGRPSCGEGCLRFAWSSDGYRLDPEDGSIVPVAAGGSELTLSPDRRWLAYVTWRDGRGAVAVQDLATGEERSLAFEDRDPDVNQRSAIGNLTWSPDSRHLALVELFGSCPDENASKVYIVNRPDMNVAYQERFDDPPMWPAQWVDKAHLRLESLSGFHYGAETRLISITEEP